MLFFAYKYRDESKAKADVYDSAGAKIATVVADPNLPHNDRIRDFKLNLTEIRRSGLADFSKPFDAPDYSEGIGYDGFLAIPKHYVLLRPFREGGAHVVQVFGGNGEPLPGLAFAVDCEAGGKPAAPTLAVVLAVQDGRWFLRYAAPNVPFSIVMDCFALATDSGLGPDAEEFINQSFPEEDVALASGD